MVQPLWERGQCFLKKLNTELLYDLEIPLLYIYMQTNWKEELIFVHLCSEWHYNSQKVKIIQMSTDWVNG